MITDARRLPPDAELRCDICIVGAGAAGITLACELQSSGNDVVLLESGSEKTESTTQDLYKGEIGDPRTHGRLDLYRQRRFGGTTTVWGGRCAPFDDIDFVTKVYVPYSGWPIQKSDLDPYYIRAHSYCHLGAYTYNRHLALPNGGSEMIPGFESVSICTDRLWRFSLPTNFAEAFGSRFRHSSNPRVYLHANCLRIRLRSDGHLIDHLEVASFVDKKFTVRARWYVLATGGLEVVRLLLVSDDVHTTGIGNNRDLVGRFYSSHVSGDLCEVAFTSRQNQLIWDYERTKDNVYCRRAISIKEETQASNGLLNFRATLNHPPVHDPRHHNGILSGMYLFKRYLAHKIPPEYSKALSVMSPLEEVSAHIANVFRDPVRLVGFSGTWLRKRMLTKRKLPSLMLRSKSGIYTLHFDAEQSPNPDNRVTLSSTKDVFGIRRLKVNWTIRDVDVQSVIRSCRLLSEELQRSKVGYLLCQPELMEEHIRNNCSVGSHHMGTTRMATSASHGVVDEDCRVHGVENLYIASSSVFPTSGVANPTLTIVALTIRLADHLKAYLQTGGNHGHNLTTGTSIRADAHRQTSGALSHN